jgi:hypothetical protein
MKYSIAIAVALVLGTGAVASADECIWHVNYDMPIGMNDPAAQQLRCWVQSEGGDWQCSQYECTNIDSPSWTYRATLSVCSGDTCTQSVVNGSGDVVFSGTSARGANAFTAVNGVDYQGNHWSCDLVSDSPGSGSGLFYTFMCRE